MNASLAEPYGGPLWEVEGAVDMHCHPYPDLFPRVADDYDIVLAAKEAAMRAVVLKCHHESTVSRAYHMRRAVPGINVYGGIVLNSYVGYLNPAAVEASLRLGGKVVWMPTVDAGYHAEMHGSTGGYDSQAGGRNVGEGVWVLDEEGNLKDEVFEIFELVAEHNAILGTCHLSPREIVTLVRTAAEKKIQKVVVTHPFFKVPNLDLPTLEEIVRLGAYPEFGYCTVSPSWHYSTPEKVAEAIARVGASRCLLVSDTGQRHNPFPHEALRIFVQSVYEQNIAEDDINYMIRRNPMDLLDLESDMDHRRTEDAPTDAESVVTGDGTEPGGEVPEAGAASV